MKKLIITAMAVILMVGCTQQQRAKQFGGKTTVELAPNEKLLNVTWEQDHLWYLTRAMKTNEVAENYILHESSSWGVWQGEIIFHEHQ